MLSTQVYFIIFVTTVLFDTFDLGLLVTTGANVAAGLCGKVFNMWDLIFRWDWCYSEETV